MSQLSQPTADEATPVADVKAPTVKSLQRFIRSVLILSLSVLCVVGGLLIYQLHARLDKATPVLPKINKVQTVPSIRLKTIQKETTPSRFAPLASKPQPSPSSNTLTVPSDSKNSESIKKEDILPAETTEKAPDTKAMNPEEELPLAEIEPAETPAQQNEETIQNSAPETPSTLTGVSRQTDVNVPTPISNAPYFTLQDALMLRDHLQAGKSCRTDFQKLLKSQTVNHTWYTLIEQLTPICATNKEPLNEIRSLFRKEHKRAIIAYYRQNNPWWLAYLKAVPATMIEIRKLNPTTQTPLDLLFSAQNALSHGDLKQTADLIHALPQPMQMAFHEFNKQMDLYLKAQNETEQLVLSFEQKGK